MVVFDSLRYGCEYRGISRRIRPYPTGGLPFCTVSCAGGIPQERNLKCDAAYITQVHGQRAAVSLAVCDRRILAPARHIAYVTDGILPHKRHGLVYLSHTSSLAVLLHTPLPSYFNSHFLTVILHFIFHFRQSSYSHIPALYFPKLQHTVPVHHLV